MNNWAKGKIILSDYDGTYYSHNEEASRRNRRAVKEFTEAGGLFTIASGRLSTACLSESDLELINAPMLLANGGKVAFIGEEPLWENTMDPRLAEEVRVAALEAFPDAGGELYYNESEDRIYKFTFWGKPETMDKIDAFVRKRYGNVFDYTYSSPTLFELMPVGINKGTALKRLCKWYKEQGIELTSIGAGNYLNDLELLSAADVAVCPNNSCDEVIAVSDIVLCRDSEGAIADLIYRMKEKECIMRTLKLKNAKIFDSETKSFKDGALVAQDGIIVKICEDIDDADAVDMGGKYIIPGMVDVHSHGRAGYDFDSASVSEFHEMQRAYAKAGTTTVMATIASAPIPQIESYIENCKETYSNPMESFGAAIGGIHFEGRYLNPGKRGAHNAELLAPLDANELEGFLNLAKPLPVHISAAVELPGGEEFTKKAVSMGATVGLGHTEANVDDARKALEWGVTSFTHTFNAMSPIHHRTPGTMLASLILDDAWSEVIVDGFHVCGDMVSLLHREKPDGKLVLISDSMAATGCPDGDDYSIAGMPVTVKDGKAYTSDGAIAGSTLNLFDGMKNYAKFTGCAIENAINCGSLYPAQMVGIDDKCGSIAVGKRADLLVVSDLDPEKMELVNVYTNGYSLN